MRPPPVAPNWSRPSAPPTVYVKILYRIVGQDYCRYHIIRIAVAAGAITEIRSGAGSGAVVSLRE